MSTVEELRDRKQTDVEWRTCNILGLLGLTNDDILPKVRKELDFLIAAAREEESAKIIHCGECVYAKWESQEPFGKGEGIACHIVAGRSRPWLDSVADHCSVGRRKVKP